MLIGMLLGWGIGSAAMRAALAARNQEVARATLQKTMAGYVLETCQCEGVTQSSAGFRARPTLMPNSRMTSSKASSWTLREWLQWIVCIYSILNDRKARQLYLDRKSTRLNSSHSGEARMPSSA